MEITESNTKKSNVLVSQVECLVGCDCHPGNYIPHTILDGWECKKCGSVKSREDSKLRWEHLIMVCSLVITAMALFYKG